MLSGRLPTFYPQRDMSAEINQPVRDFIGRFIGPHPQQGLDPASILVDSFGDSPEMADQLLALVLAGTKTATCSALWAWEHDNDAPLQPGMLSVIVDGAGQPRCVLETTQTRVMGYQDVPADFARAEGEHEPPELPDEQVLAHWRHGHWAFFTRTLPPLGYTPSPDMPVICERFRVIYQEPSP